MNAREREEHSISLAAGKAMGKRRCTRCGREVRVTAAFELYSHRDSSGDRCHGETAAETFQHVLRNAELALIAPVNGVEMRLPTDAEIDDMRRAEAHGHSTRRWQ